jgi:hypothetical protein
MLVRKCYVIADALYPANELDAPCTINNNGQGGRSTYIYLGKDGGIGAASDNHELMFTGMQKVNLGKIATPRTSSKIS